MLHHHRRGVLRAWHFILCRETCKCIHKKTDTIYIMTFPILYFISYIYSALPVDILYLVLKFSETIMMNNMRQLKFDLFQDSRWILLRVYIPKHGDHNLSSPLFPFWCFGASLEKKLPMAHHNITQVFP